MFNGVVVVKACLELGSRENREPRSRETENFGLKRNGEMGLEL